MRMHILIAVILTATVQAVDLTSPVNVPDPFGLGERLALVDYLQENKVAFASAEDLHDLRRLYLQATKAKVTPGEEEEERRQARIALAIRRDLKERFGINADEETDLPTLRNLLTKTEADAKEKERTRLLAILSQRFSLQMHPDASYESVRTTYDSMIRDLQESRRRLDEEKSFENPVASVEQTDGGQAAPQAETPTTAHVKPDVRPRAAPSIDVPISTSRYWDNFASVPTLTSEGLRLAVYLAAKDLQAGVLSVPPEDLWAVPKTSGFTVMATSGWPVEKRVTLEIDSRQTVVVVAPGGRINLHPCGYGVNRIPYVKIVKVE